MPPSKTLRLAASEAMQLSLKLDHSKLPKNTIVMLIQVPGSEGMTVSKKVVDLCKGVLMCRA